MSKNYIAKIFSILLLAIFGVIIFFALKSKSISFTCEGVLVDSVHHDEPVFSYQITHRLIIGENNIARREINGFGYSNNKRYTYNRTIIYRYNSLNGENNKYHIKVIEVRKSGADNIPTELEEKFLSYDLIGSERTVGLRETSSGDFLFLSANGPFFMCDRVH